MVAASAAVLLDLIDGANAPARAVNASPKRMSGTLLLLPTLCQVSGKTFAAVMAVLGVIALLGFGVVTKGEQALEVGEAAPGDRARGARARGIARSRPDRVARGLPRPVGPRQHLGLVVRAVQGRVARPRRLPARARARRRLHRPRHPDPGRNRPTASSSSRSSASTTPRSATARATTPTSSAPPASPRRSSSTPRARSPTSAPAPSTPQILETEILPLIEGGLRPRLLVARALSARRHRAAWRSLIGGGIGSRAVGRAPDHPPRRRGRGDVPGLRHDPRARLRLPARQSTSASSSASSSPRASRRKRSRTSWSPSSAPRSSPTPSTEGFDLAAWVVPGLAVLAGGAARLRRRPPLAWHFAPAERNQSATRQAKRPRTASGSTRISSATSCRARAAISVSRSSTAMTAIVGARIRASSAPSCWHASATV